MQPPFVQVKDAPMVGISFGSASCRVAVWLGTTGTTEVICNELGERSTPSCVSYCRETGRVFVGSEALVRRGNANTFYDLKRIIGKRYSDIALQKDIKERGWPFRVLSDTFRNNPKAMLEVHAPGGETRLITPEEVVSHLLLKMRHIAEDYLGQPIEKVVLTVPAYFPDSYRAAVKDAVQMANMHLLRMIQEPTALVMAVGFGTGHGFAASVDPPSAPAINNNPGEQRLIVVDIGRSCLDVSCMIQEEGFFEARATTGDLSGSVGGAEMDARLAKHVRSQLVNQIGEQAVAALDTRELLATCEAAKERLTSCDATDVELTVGDVRIRVKVTRAEFESLIADIVKKVRAVIERAMKLAKFPDVAEIDGVVLAGGTGAVPCIIAMIVEYFGRDILLYGGVYHPAEAAVQGAAIQVAILCGDKHRMFEPVCYIEVNPHCIRLGIGKNREQSMVLIAANNSIPTKKAILVSTTVDNQATIPIHVFEGDSDVSSENRLLCAAILEGVAPAPAGVPQITVSFEIDSDGLLSITGEDKSQRSPRIVARIVSHERLQRAEIAVRVTEEAKRKQAEHAQNALTQSCAELRTVDEKRVIMGLLEEARQLLDLASVSEGVTLEMKYNLYFSKREQLEERLRTLLRDVLLLAL